MGIHKRKGLLVCPRGTVDFDIPGTSFYMSPEQMQGEPVMDKLNNDIAEIGAVLRITRIEDILGFLSAWHNSDTDRISSHTFR